MTASRTTISRGNEDEDKKLKKLGKATIAISIAGGALLVAKLYFLWFWPW